MLGISQRHGTNMMFLFLAAPPKIMTSRRRMIYGRRLAMRKIAFVHQSSGLFRSSWKIPWTDFSETYGQILPSQALRPDISSIEYRDTFDGYLSRKKFSGSPSTSIVVKLWRHNAYCYCVPRHFRQKNWKLVWLNSSHWERIRWHRQFILRYTNARNDWLNEDMQCRSQYTSPCCMLS